MGGILLLLAKLVDFAVSIYIFIIFARAIISWVQPNPYNPIVLALYRFTEPVLYPIRRMLLRILRSIGINIGIDFSPLVVIALLYIFRKFLLTILLY